MNESKHSVPRVQVLLATFNGAPWIGQQVDSILNQQGVDVAVVVSDDHSSDDTLAQLQRALGADARFLPRLPHRLGSAHRNFLRLVRDTDLGDADYVALADQDDIWSPRKLARGIKCLRSHGAQGYSSNVTAFWPDGTRRLIDKAQPQRPLDHWFGSPGPGCTFVLPRDVFAQLQVFVTDHYARAESAWVHDWLIYAFVRCRGGRWHIDDLPTMLYRQHDHNEIGANRGWRAAMTRLRRVRSGAYRRDILAVADALGESTDVIEAVRRLALRDRLTLLLRVREFRRRLRECVMLGLLILVMPRA